MCSNLLSPAVASFGPWRWFSSSWRLKSQSDPFCPIALTMCSDTRSAGGGSHRSSGIRRADLPARRQQLGGGRVQSLCVPRTKSWPFPRVGLRPWVGSDWAPPEIRFTRLTRECWRRGWEKLQNTISVKSQRLQVETRKRKKGTERNRVVSEKKKSAHSSILPHCQETLKPSFFPTIC